MVKKLEEQEAPKNQPLKKAKNFLWRIIQIFFGLLFICSIVACVLFATGIIAIVEDGNSGDIRLKFVSPLTPESEGDSANTPTQSNNSTTPSNNTADFNGDNVGWGPAIDRDCEEGNSSCAQSRENLPSIASFDMDIDGLLYNAGAKHPGESLSVTDIRFTSNGRYAVAKLVSNLVQNDTVVVRDLYFYRSTYDSQGWNELKGLGNNQTFNCIELTEIQKLIIEDAYSERGCGNNDNY